MRSPKADQTGLDNQQGNRWISPKEAALRLGRTPDRVRQMARKGQLVIKWTPLGRLVDAESVEAVLQARENIRVAP